jgi:hypothetical protein
LRRPDARRRKRQREKQPPGQRKEEETQKHHRCAFANIAPPSLYLSLLLRLTYAAVTCVSTHHLAVHLVQMPPCARGKATDDHQTEWFGSSTLSSTSLLSSLVHSWAPPDSARRPAESSQLLMKYSMRRLSRAILHSVRCMGDRQTTGILFNA